MDYEQLERELRQAEELVAEAHALGESINKRLARAEALHQKTSFYINKTRASLAKRNLGRAAHFLEFSEAALQAAQKACEEGG